MRAQKKVQDKLSTTHEVESPTSVDPIAVITWNQPIRYSTVQAVTIRDTVSVTVEVRVRDTSILVK